MDKEIHTSTSTFWKVIRGWEWFSHRKPQWCMWFVNGKGLLSGVKGVFLATYFLSNYWEVTVCEEILLTNYQCKVSANSLVLALQNEWTLNWAIVFTHVYDSSGTGSMATSWDLWQEWTVHFIFKNHPPEKKKIQDTSAAMLFQSGVNSDWDVTIQCRAFYKYWMLEDEDKGEKPRPVGRKQ